MNVIDKQAKTQIRQNVRIAHISDQLSIAKLKMFEDELSKSHKYEFPILRTWEVIHTWELSLRRIHIGNTDTSK
jgi:hypothetical protein